MSTVAGYSITFIYDICVQYDMSVKQRSPNMSQEEQRRITLKEAYQNGDLEQPYSTHPENLFLAYTVLVFFAPVLLLSIGIIWTRPEAILTAFIVPIVSAVSITSLLSRYTLPKTEIAFFAVALFIGGLVTPLSLAVSAKHLSVGFTAVPVLLSVVIATVTSHLISSVYWDSRPMRLCSVFTGFVYGGSIAGVCLLV